MGDKGGGDGGVGDGGVGDGGVGGGDVGGGQRREFECAMDEWKIVCESK